MKLELLRVEKLYEAQRIAADLFPWEREHQPALEAAVRPKDFRPFLDARHLSSIRCWTVAAPTGSLAGLASLYSYKAQPDEVWLAWYGMVPEARGRGVGRALLDCVIDEAAREGRSTLRLWTTDESEYDRARDLYLRRGFIGESHPSLPGETWGTLVYSLGLGGKSPLPWSLVARTNALCGREAPSVEAVAA